MAHPPKPALTLKQFIKSREKQDYEKEVEMKQMRLKYEDAISDLVLAKREIEHLQKENIALINVAQSLRKFLLDECQSDYHKMLIDSMIQSGIYFDFGFDVVGGRALMDKLEVSEEIE